MRRVIIDVFNGDIKILGILIILTQSILLIEQINTQTVNDTTIIITKTDILQRLYGINKNVLELDKDLAKINKGIGSLNDIERINEYQAIYTMQIDWTSRLIGMYLNQNIEINNILETVKKNVELSSNNVGIVTNNFYLRNANTNILNILLGFSYQAILKQYPFLKIPLEYIFKYYELLN